MDTLLDVGNNLPITAGVAARTSNVWFAWDNYRRFLQNYGLPYDLSCDDLDTIISDFKRQLGTTLKRQFSGDQMRQVAIANQFHIDVGYLCLEKSKSISFDAMVKFFMLHYEIPTKHDVERLMARMDRLESLIKSALAAGRAKGRRRRSSVPAADTVLDAIKRSKQGLKFVDIQAKTGFVDKKIRNIIFRLNKLGKIKRHSRGVYVAI